jgi:hypothetical protein
MERQPPGINIDPTIMQEVVEGCVDGGEPSKVGMECYRDLQGGQPTVSFDLIAFWPSHPGDSRSFVLTSAVDGVHYFSSPITIH